MVSSQRLLNNISLSTGMSLSKFETRKLQPVFCLATSEFVSDFETNEMVLE